MSIISEKLRVAIYAKLNVASVTSAGATGVYYHRVPEFAVLPYVVFSRVAPGTLMRATFGNSLLENDLWQISGFADEDSDNDREPQTVIADMLAAAETSLADNITITGASVKYAKKFSELPSMSELSNGRWIYQEGFNFQTQVSIV